MPRFFLPKEEFGTDLILLRGENANHISRALRMRVGDEITVCDCANREYRCRLAGFTADTVEAQILECRDCQSEPPYAATLYMALPKSDKLEWIIQKSVELGVGAIVPVKTERCIMKLDRDVGKKLERWQKIADNAAGQCGRGILPRVREPMDFAEAVREGAAAELPLFCYEAAAPEAALRCRLPGQAPRTVALFVGSEGGFSPAEAGAAEENGWLLTSLGRRILRCETAPVAVLAALAAAYE